MNFHLRDRWGAMESLPCPVRLSEVLDQLEAEDDEHISVSLTHESEWCLSAYSGGLLVWENLEEGEPRHMSGAHRPRMCSGCG